MNPNFIDLPYISGAWRCHECGRMEVRSLPNPTTYTLSTPRCHYCSGYRNGVETHVIMTPADDGAFYIEKIGGDPWRFCKAQDADSATNGDGSHQ